MSQAAVDLPDHLDKSADPLANPDELLSQLAGSEIDRLLAEADVAPAPAAPAPTATPAAANKNNDDVASQLDDLLNDLDEKKAPAASGPEDAVATAKLSDAVDAELAEKGVDATPEGLEREAMLQAAGFENGADHAAAAEKENPAGTERSSLLAAAGFESGEANDAETDGDASAEAWEQPLPLIFKPLEWLNAPLESCPEHIREILGKIGIVTLVNALAVLGYLLIFKKH